MNNNQANDNNVTIQYKNTTTEVDQEKLKLDYFVKYFSRKIENQVCKALDFNWDIYETIEPIIKGILEAHLKDMARVRNESVAGHKEKRFLDVCDVLDDPEWFISELGLLDINGERFSKQEIICAIKNEKARRNDTN